MPLPSPVRVRCSLLSRVTVRARVMGMGLLPTTSYSISYTTLNAEDSPSGELSGDVCSHRMGPHSNDAGTLAGGLTHFPIIRQSGLPFRVTHSDR